MPAKSRSARMSSSKNAAAGSTLRRFPEARLSTTVTSSPRARSASTRFDPMNPAPPVTTVRTAAYRRPGMFISFEGIDGSGKSTQATLLHDWLVGQQHEVVYTREPGGTALGEGVRQLLLEGPDMTAWAEAALYASARAELVERVIRPALERDAWVICDRYIDSSVAYQGIGRGLGVGRVLELNLAATRGLMPDLTFVLLP